MADIDWAAVISAGAQAYSAYNASQTASENAASATDPANRSSSTSQSESYGENSSQISAEGRATRAAGYDALSPLWNSQQYSRENAIKDVQGSIAEIFRQYSITDLPKIFSGMTSSGGYNSTSHQFLANEAFANATAKGAALTNQAVLNYAQARQAELSPLVALLNADREGFGMEMSSSSTDQLGGADTRLAAESNTEADKRNEEAMRAILGAFGAAKGNA